MAPVHHRQIDGIGAAPELDGVQAVHMLDLSGWAEGSAVLVVAAAWARSSAAWRPRAMMSSVDR